MLYRRERDRVGDERVRYTPPTLVTLDSVLVEKLYDFSGIDVVFYTRIGANLSEILDPEVSPDKKARLLAYLAIESLTIETYDRKRDGIEYLLENLDAGVETPLSHDYKEVILKLADEAPNLTQARMLHARKKGLNL